MSEPNEPSELFDLWSARLVWALNFLFWIWVIT